MGCSTYNHRHSATASSSSSDADTYSSSSAVDQALLLIQSDDPDLKLQAVREIRQLTKASKWCRRQLGQAILPLVSMLRVTDSTNNELLLLALLNLAVKDDENKATIVSSGALQPLISFLQSQSSTLQEYATALLLTLSAYTPNKPIIAAFGAIHFIVEIIRDGCPQAKIDAVMALYNLSSHENNIKIILETKPVPSIINVLANHKKTSKTAEKCTALLEILLRCEEGRSALISEESGLFSIVEVLENGALISREYAVGALLTMCESNICKYRESILREGVIPSLLELTIEGTPTSQSKARTLLKLLRDFPCAKSNMLENSVQRYCEH
ncbi:hypothetical protein ACFE04_006838 [Oxalis oulophora]